MAGLAAHWQAKRRAALPPSSRLCNAPRNYVVKRQMNGVIYSPGLFMRGGWWGGRLRCFSPALFER